ncbi:hypothetical protein CAUPRSCDRAFT_13207, partial [Caulochytrium protostelioides]
MIYSFEEGDELVGVGFQDISNYAVSLAALKRMVIVSDITKSVSLLAFQEYPPKLTLVSRDYHSLPVLSAEFLVREGQLGLLAFDADRNLHVLRYAPDGVSTDGGQRLVRGGEFHIDTDVHRVVRIQHATGAPAHLALALGADGAVAIVQT